MPGDLRLGPAQPVPLRHGPGRPRRAVLHQRRRTGGLGGDRPGRQGCRLRVELPRGGPRQPPGWTCVLAGARGARRAHLRVRPHELWLDHRGRLSAHRLLAFDPRRELLLQRLQLRDDLRARSPGGRRLRVVELRHRPRCQQRRSPGLRSLPGRHRPLLHELPGRRSGARHRLHGHRQSLAPGEARREPDHWRAAPVRDLRCDRVERSRRRCPVLRLGLRRRVARDRDHDAHHGAHLPGARRVHRNPPGQGQLGRALGPRGRDRQRRATRRRCRSSRRPWRATSSASASR